MRVKIKVDDKKTAQSIKALLNKKASLFFGPKYAKIEPAVHAVMRRWISESPEILSLRSGDLRVQFGLSLAQSNFVCDQIIDFFTKSLKLRNPKMSSLLTGSISIAFVIPSYDMFYQIPGTEYVSPQSGQSIPWLRWLLEEAQSVQITNFRVMRKPNGRSGDGFMIKHKGRYWRIPAPFDQAEENNFINRILRNDRFQKEVTAAVQKVLS
jgi:hypothetical protein